ncbi:hypothetical protein PR202_ga29784 [Eleusine coracana subsp. coracana]|uniref:Uncharacterized protein n=1 Tax=Eleusine coracana subsp. coracana TaxID=191504 RepID=A0AAV5DM72_ELECO|nr:hypothetical protein PR202_ga29784 [Eleusine coracana subsp. coracana]
MTVAAAATQLCAGAAPSRRRKGLDLRWARLLRLAIVSRVLRLVRDQLLACSTCGGGRGGRYRRLGPPAVHAAGAAPSPVKYVGNGDEQNGLQMTGLNLMDKTLPVRGARIAYTIWDVAGDSQFVDHVPIACKDAVAILYMFDLTSRCTLNNIIDWYERARKWNKTAIPILIGTKFDDFAQLPLEMQWAIVNQARAYARAMKATLFFSSATHNINVNKIFKFITAKLFNLPWTVERNLTIGEPIIDF